MFMLRWLIRRNVDLRIIIIIKILSAEDTSKAYIHITKLDKDGF